MNRVIRSLDDIERVVVKILHSNYLDTHICRNMSVKQCKVMKNDYNLPQI